MEEIELLKRRLKCSFILVFIIIFFCIMVLFLLNHFVIVKEYYKASDFKIKTIYSNIDFNKNGIDDYSDFLLGAKKVINKNEVYENFIVKVFKYAGYDLDKMVERYYEDYNLDIGKKDRISMYKSFINSNALKVDVDFDKIELFQPGDFVFLQDGIGVLSDKRNKDGISFIVMINDGKVVEEDCLEDLKISGHYRFDSSLIEDDLLKR